MQPSFVWKQLHDKPPSSRAELHQAIVHGLRDYCFDSTPDVLEAIPFLQKSMATMDEMIEGKPLGVISLKDAISAAKNVGYEVIGTMTRDRQPRLLFESALIVLLSFHKDVVLDKYADTQQLLASEAYSDWSPPPEPAELEMCRVYANFMALAVQLQPAKGKKAHLTDLVTRITEGKNVKVMLNRIYKLFI